MPLKTYQLPYVSFIEHRGDLSLWVVNGSYIRTNIDEEFTNFGQHYRHSYIPRNELWFDIEAHPDERIFFIEHALVEQRLMENGFSYDDALTHAGRAERKLRRALGDVTKILENKKLIPHLKKVHKYLWKTLENGLEVWVVEGRLVRSVFDIDFTAGGHSHVYEFIPTMEVWIDDDIVEDERVYILLHELCEYTLMAQEKTYHDAHTNASQLEYYCRQHPDEAHEKLAQFGWN